MVLGAALRLTSCSRKASTSLTETENKAIAWSGQSMPADVSFSQSAQSVEVYDFVEVTLNVSKPDAGNPFTDVAVQGSFEKTSGADKLSVTGFCDASDGSVFRIRFMPASEGDYFLSSVSAALILNFTSSITSTTGAPENSGKGGSSAQ